MVKKLTYPLEGGNLYNCNYTVNGHLIKRLIISNHYKKKHAKYMSDKLIIKFIEDYLDGEILQWRKEKTLRIL